MTTAYTVLVLIFLPLIIMLIKNWRQTIFRKRVAQALQNFQQATQAQIEEYFISKKWSIPPPKKLGSFIILIFLINFISKVL